MRKIMGSIVSLTIALSISFLFFQVHTLKKENQKAKDEHDSTLALLLRCNPNQVRQAKSNPGSYLDVRLESPRLNAWVIQRLARTRIGELTFLNEETVERIKSDLWSFELTRKVFRGLAMSDSRGWFILDRWDLVKIIEEPHDLAQHYGTPSVRKACFEQIKMISRNEIGKPSHGKLSDLLRDCLEIGFSKDNLRMLMLSEKVGNEKTFDRVWGKVPEEFGIDLK